MNIIKCYFIVNINKLQSHSIFIASFSLSGETFFFKVITEIKKLEGISAVQGIQIVQEYLLNIQIKFIEETVE